MAGPIRLRDDNEHGLFNGGDEFGSAKQSLCRSVRRGRDEGAAKVKLSERVANNAEDHRTCEATPGTKECGFQGLAPVVVKKNGCVIFGL